MYSESGHMEHDTRLFFSHHFIRNHSTGKKINITSEKRKKKKRKNVFEIRKGTRRARRRRVRYIRASSHDVLTHQQTQRWTVDRSATTPRAMNYPQ